VIKLKKNQKQEQKLPETNEQNELNLSRQSKLIPKDKITQYTLKVFGVGSIGSHFVKTAAKTGFTNIEVFDTDIVEEENIAAQAFDFRHIGMKKVEAMKEIVLEGAGVEIIATHGTVTKETDIVPEPNTIYCCFFDSMEGRKIVFEKVKDFPVVFVDGRIGRYDMRHYLVDCSDKNEVQIYGDTLNVKGVSDLACGEKASAPINVQIAGMIVMNIVNFISGKDYTKRFIGNAATPKTSIHILEIKEKKEELLYDVSQEIEEEISLELDDDEFPLAELVADNTDEVKEDEDNETEDEEEANEIEEEPIEEEH